MRGEVKHIQRLLLVVGALGLSLEASATKIVSLREVSPRATPILSLELPNSWSPHENIYGVPLSILSPKISGSKRSLINFSSTTLDASEIIKQFDALKKETHSYHSGRKAWLKKHNGKLEKFFDLEEVLVSDTKALRIGMRYILAGKNFEEYSYYIPCKSSLVIAKTLYPTKNPDHEQKVLESMVLRAKCH